MIDGRRMKLARLTRYAQIRGGARGEGKHQCIKIRDVHNFLKWCTDPPGVSSRLVNLDKSRTSQSLSSDLSNVGKGFAGAADESTDGQTSGETLVVREGSEEVGLAVVDVDVGDGDSDGEVLAGDVDNGCGGGGHVGAFDAEELGAVLGGRGGLDGEAGEGIDANDINVGA